ncbi:hypothetical protein [Agromyces aerolatus]|uniref:hypothetical protein n=1 Tax=Agromyces sp. LY-1074 TaxID=3074080 RepID=UPI0028605AE9|nr:MULTISPECIES: hypothetical protein [unclassified Agromyces]MDR5701488.1 hypothetical protein [Agromyces sp. LY-1074]MDR5704445.1 hypothetical protein [Agromyces sp. LY-1358]
MTGSIQIGVGDLWTRQLRPADGLVAVISAQRRLTGHIEAFLLIAEAEAQNGALEETLVDSFARNEALRTTGYEPSFELEGQWARAPRTLKQGARAAWYRQLLSHHPRALTVTLGGLRGEEVHLPDELPVESCIDGGTTSGVLQAGSVCLLRVSTPAPETDPREPFSPVSLGWKYEPLNALYANGPLGWMDTIMCIDGSRDALTIDTDAR